MSTDDDIPAPSRYLNDKTREDLVALQQKTQRELKRSGRAAHRNDRA